jgi:hypothetical protein
MILICFQCDARDMMLRLESITIAHDVFYSPSLNPKLALQWISTSFRFSVTHVQARCIILSSPTLSVICMYDRNILCLVSCIQDSLEYARPRDLKSLPHGRDVIFHMSMFQSLNVYLTNIQPPTSTSTMQRHPFQRLFATTTPRLIIPHYTSRASFASKRGPADYSDEDLAAARKWLAALNPDTIPRSLSEITFSRSSGPGGQNVNKSDLLLATDHKSPELLRD